MLPYGRQSISQADMDAVIEVLKGDWLTTGPGVAAFEEAISALTGGHPVVSCTSGTAALHIAYAALGLGQGDEVITSPMTFVATASGAAIQGARIVFVDVEADTGLLDVAEVAATANRRTRVIAAVDYAGHPCDYDGLAPVAAAIGATTLADAAHSVGGTYRGRPVGDLADVTAMSFFPTKNFTTGEGGAVVFKDEATARVASEFHNIGLIRDPDRFMLDADGPWHQEVHAFGVNYRLSDIACALGLSQLGRLRGFKARRADIKARYDNGLRDVEGLRLPAQRDYADPVWHLYPLRVLEGRRRSLYETLRAEGIGAQVNYLPVYWHPVFSDMGYRRGMCPRAEEFYRQELSLPIFPDLTDAQVDRVIEVVRAALA